MSRAPTLRQFLQLRYPAEKRLDEERYFLFFLLRRVSPLLSFPLARLGVPPNAISSFALVLILAGALLQVGGEVGVGLIAFLLSQLLDAVDGEVARTTGRATKLGLGLESLNADLSYALPLISLAVGLTVTGHYSSPYETGLVASGAVSLLLFRRLLGRAPEQGKAPDIVLAQFKGHREARRRSQAGARLFWLRMNLFTPAGVMLPGFLFAWSIGVLSQIALLYAAACAALYIAGQVLYLLVLAPRRSEPHSVD